MANIYDTPAQYQAQQTYVPQQLGQDSLFEPYLTTIIKRQEQHERGLDYLAQGQEAAAGYQANNPFVQNFADSVRGEHISALEDVTDSMITGDFGMYADKLRQTKDAIANDPRLAQIQKYNEEYTNKVQELEDKGRSGDQLYTMGVRNTIGMYTDGDNPNSLAVTQAHITEDGSEMERELLVKAVEMTPEKVKNLGLTPDRNTGGLFLQYGQKTIKGAADILESAYNLSTGYEDLKDVWRNEGLYYARGGGVTNFVRNFTNTASNPQNQDRMALELAMLGVTLTDTSPENIRSEYLKKKYGVESLEEASHGEKERIAQEEYVSAKMYNIARAASGFDYEKTDINYRQTPVTSKTDDGGGGNDPNTTVLGPESIISSPYSREIQEALQDRDFKKLAEISNSISQDFETGEIYNKGPAARASVIEGARVQKAVSDILEEHGQRLNKGLYNLIHGNPENPEDRGLRDLRFKVTMGSPQELITKTFILEEFLDPSSDLFGKADRRFYRGALKNKLIEEIGSKKAEEVMTFLDSTTDERVIENAYLVVGQDPNIWTDNSYTPVYVTDNDSGDLYQRDLFMREALSDNFLIGGTITDPGTGESYVATSTTESKVSEFFNHPDTKVETITPFKPKAFIGPTMEVTYTNNTTGEKRKVHGSVSSGLIAEYLRKADNEGAYTRQDAVKQQQQMEYDFEVLSILPEKEQEQALTRYYNETHKPLGMPDDINKFPDPELSSQGFVVINDPVVEQNKVVYRRMQIAVDDPAYGPTMVNLSSIDPNKEYIVQDGEVEPQWFEDLEKAKKELYDIMGIAHTAEEWDEYVKNIGPSPRTEI